MQALARPQQASAIINDARASLLRPRRPVTPAVMLAPIAAIPRKLAPLSSPKQAAKPSSTDAPPAAQSVSACLQQLQQDASTGGSPLAETIQVLRDLLSARENRTKFLELHGFDCLQTVLKRASSDVRHVDGAPEQYQHTIALGVARIVSKLSSHSSVVPVLEKHAIIDNLAACLIERQDNLQVVVRLLFALGNVTGTADGPAHRTLQPYVQQLVDLLKSLSLGRLKQQTVDSKSDACSETEDALIKCIRLLANLTLSESLATGICASPSLLLLLDLASQCTLAESEELVLNILLLCNNVTYYDMGSNVLLDKRMQLLKLLPAMLLYDNTEVQVESLSILANLSRQADVVQALTGHQSAVGEILVALLDHCDAHLLRILCGVWINLLSNPQHCATLQECIDKVSDILDIGVEAVDVKLCTVWCRMLSNFLVSQHGDVPLHLRDELCATLQEALDADCVASDLAHKLIEMLSGDSGNPSSHSGETQRPISDNYQYLEPLPAPPDYEEYAGNSGEEDDL
ncbi:hypothetical protein RI367_002837 [Sorochytrium milnesiophthora]